MKILSAHSYVSVRRNRGDSKHFLYVKLLILSKSDNSSTHQPTLTLMVFLLPIYLMKRTLLKDTNLLTTKTFHELEALMIKVKQWPHPNLRASSGYLENLLYFVIGFSLSEITNGKSIKN